MKSVCTSKIVITTPTGLAPPTGKEQSGPTHHLSFMQLARSTIGAADREPTICPPFLHYLIAEVLAAPVEEQGVASIRIDVPLRVGK